MASWQRAGATEDSQPIMNESDGSTSKGSEEVRKSRNDRELVERVQAGDERAFRELFDAYHRRAFSVAVGVVKNPQDAMDIVQDAFVKVHKHIHGFKGTSSFYTWLYRIVMNLAIDHVRKAQNAAHADYDERSGRQADNAAGDGALLPRIMDSNPGKTVARRELTRHMQAALDTLPEHHRAVILLREIEGMSYEEMAETLEVPKGTIMSRLFHARKKMQQTLEAYLEGDLQIEESS